MTDESKKMLTLAEEVANVLVAAPKPLALAGVKKGLKAAGIETGKGGVSKALLAAALNAKGVFTHPPAKAGGQPSYWNKPPKSADELAAEAAEKAAAAKAKEDEKAAKVAEAARKKAEREAKAIAEAKAKAANAAEAARKKAEREAKAIAEAEEKAAKEADKAAKPLRVLREKVHAKVLQLGDKIVAGSGIGKPMAKAKPELHNEFERILGQLLEEKKLFEHPGGKYGRKPYEDNSCVLNSLFLAHC